MAWIKRHLGSVIGGIALLWALVRWAIQIGGDIDFLVSLTKDLGWVGALIELLLDPPPLAIPMVIVVGLGLIYLDARRRVAPVPLLQPSDAPKAIATPVGSQGPDPTSLPPGDIPLMDAIWCIYVGKWGVRQEIDPGHEDALTPFHLACQEVRQKAFEGKLPIWATNAHNQLLQPVPPEFWRSRCLEPEFMARVKGNDVWVTIETPIAVGEVPYSRTKEWRNFNTNRRVVEVLWPPRKARPWVKAG